MLKKFSLVEYSVEHPALITALMVVSTAVIVLLAALPTVFPDQFTFLNPAKIDTDPENMLSPDEAVRVFHDTMKNEMSLNDIIVLGIVNEKHPDGVFNVASLNTIYELTEFVKTLRWPDETNPEITVGVVDNDIIAPSTVDNIEQEGMGTLAPGPAGIRFEWLMGSLITTGAEALEIRRKIERLPFLKGTLVSEDGKALCLYLPITHKNLSYKIYSSLKEKIASFHGDETFLVTGLPVAEDTFGVEMFKQMAVTAPAAMGMIFILMLLFFRKLSLIIAPMILAMVASLTNMGLLIVTGNTVHIMSSMIPIFIMPIAILDSIHVLSEFFERYQATRDRKRTIISVMGTLNTAMFYTSITTAAGFLSLALTPIPPVIVFGIFIAIGVMLAWVWTVTFIPAYVMLLSEKSLENFGIPAGPGAMVKSPSAAGQPSLLSSLLEKTGAFTIRYARAIIIFFVFVTVISIYGITKITINDNPVKWFEPSHPIRIADKMLNAHFGGTYEAYLALTGDPGGETFKQPAMLDYLSGLQDYLLRTGTVGKSNSIADIVKTLHRELLGGGEGEYRIPKSPEAVGQVLFQYESSHRPQDIWHFVTPDFSKAVIWLQMKSGDNKDMQRVEKLVNGYLADNPPPGAVTSDWFGLTYINVIWQEKMVRGMLDSFLGSFVVVFIMMVFLFRSFIWGLLSMIPLTIGIVMIYGMIGFIGKDYDMPVAVLSSLSLGLAVDYAIHFLERVRQLHKTGKPITEVLTDLFKEPARSIFRNIIAIGVGFLPLLFASLVPYQTVGVFISAILLTGGFITILLLPALVKILAPWLFPKPSTIRSGNDAK